MKLLVTISGHFNAVGNDIFSHHLTYDRFWKRYLTVFDSVTVVARVKRVETLPDNWNKSTGEGVEFCAVPDFYGTWQYLRIRDKVNAIVIEATKRADAYILRVPCTLGTAAWHHLVGNKLPYAVEVVANPWDALAPGNMKTPLRPLLRWKLSRDLVRQCRFASAACYVTESSLQKRYPPGGWATFCSDVELPDDAIANEATGELRFEKTKQKIKSGEPWQLIFIGSLNNLHKAPDVLISAVTECIKKGVKLELTILGDGRLRSQLERQVKRLGVADCVRFLGLIPAGKDVFDQLDKSDLFILPSRTEGLPRTIMEGMARGIPCIGSTVGGFPELLAREDLVRPADVRALTAKIVGVLGDTNKLAEMSKRNVETIRKRFLRADLEKRWVEFYRKVAELTSKQSSQGH
jgi:glycosyltransferase involved in cell wall biosynthesis